MIIGITGTAGAGKNTVANYLLSKGFSNYSYLADSLEKEKNFVIKNIKLEDVEKLKNQKDFILFFIDADVETRYSRIVDKNESEVINLNDFVSREESLVVSGSFSNLQKFKEIANYSFKNDWTKEELFKKIERALEQIENKKEVNEVVNKKSMCDYVRPTWDEYFMEICKTVAKRATCDRGRTACVIVRDKHILVTGYVGSAKGLPHCDEVGHQLEDTIHGDGIKRAHCVRTSHGEQNAICQAAKLGISINGATAYCKLEPCPVCAKMLINSGIKRVVCEKRYQSGAHSLFEEAGVLVEILIDEIEKY